MAEYTVRQGFVVFVDGVVYSSGDRVELSDELYKLYRHRLEGSSRAGSIEFEVVKDRSSIAQNAPYIRAVEPNKFLENSTARISIEGAFFTPETTVEIRNVTVRKVEFVNSSFLIIDCFTGSAGIKSLTINNGTLSSESAVTVLTREDSIIDLREGGTSFGENAIEVRDDMSWERTLEGLLFRGRNPNGSWGRFVGDDDAWVWNRERKRTISFIFKNGSSCFVGIGSRSINPNDGLQFRQAEIVTYLSSSINLVALYGNNGVIGSTAYQQIYTSFASGKAVKKITFTNNGEAGATVSAYELSSDRFDNWTDTTRFLGSYQIDSSFLGNQTEIMPFVIPRDGDRTLFLGMILL